MELIIIGIAFIAIIIVNSMMKINIKELEKIALDKELNTITEKYPKNTEICICSLGNDAGIIGAAMLGTVGCPNGAVPIPPSGIALSGSGWFCFPKFMNKIKKKK